MLRVESASEVQSWRDLGITMVEPMLWAEDLGDWWEGTALYRGAVAMTEPPRTVLEG